MQLTPEDAIVRSIWELCDSNEDAKKFTEYYKLLEKDNKERNISNRRNDINTSDGTMNKRYVDLVGIQSTLQLDIDRLEEKNYHQMEVILSEIENRNRALHFTKNTTRRAEVCIVQCCR